MPVVDATVIARPTGDLDWLRLEFRLTDSELARVRQLHEGYLPRCREYCAQIDARKRELQPLLDASPNGIADVLPDAAASPGEATQVVEQARLVRTAVDKLSDDLREAILLCKWEDLTMAEAVALLEASPKAIESRLYRARQILRERLKRCLQ